MDPITQGALGAVAATCVADSSRLRFAAALGWAGGMLADADIFIRSTSDPLLNIEYHRHFTHALIFIPVGGLICAGVLWWLVRRRLSFSQALLYSTAGYATAGLLDARTSYGTQLLWPFSDLRVSWNIISVVDPLYTLPLLVLLGLGVAERRAAWARRAFVFSLAYLALGLVQRERASAALQQLAAGRGHRAIARATVKPTLGNLLLWRSIYVHDDRYFVDGIRVGAFGPAVIYPGENVPVFEPEAAMGSLPEGSVLANDVRRFVHFSEGYVARLPDREYFLTDVRYSPLPHTLTPLWGVDVAGRGPDEHVAWVDRDLRNSRDVGATFLTMLRGRPLVPDAPQ